MLTSTKIVKITKFSLASAVRLPQSLNAAANTIYFLPLENKCQDFNLWGWPKRDGLSEPFCVHSCLFDQSWSMECWWLNQLIGDHTWSVFVLSSPLSVISPVIIIVMLWVNISDILIHVRPWWYFILNPNKRKYIDKRMSLMRLTPGNMLSWIRIRLALTNVFAHRTQITSPNVIICPLVSGNYDDN